ncbi:hypothetical protein [Microcystis aeruginosa]|uniref:Uncharacterized protein n=1 Tax=Microcystis aeruginosa PCC 9701 TaxID=721123 RepID=I4IMK2_MICAE|nr:hypothetical protein [Microcystis aeruginosa]CCI35526.1 hypothetical protein MICAK_1720013 [Microcystis aeruginosa PCC 9701]
MTKNLWTRDELLIALNLYYKFPYGQFHTNNPVIIEVAQKLQRTPSALVMKLCNFGSLDPRHQLRGVQGLKGKYLSKINYTYLTTSCLLPLASCLLPIFTRKLILHDYLSVKLIDKSGRSSMITGQN